MGTATSVYLADNDDIFPRGFGYYPVANGGTGHMWSTWHDTPANWRTTNAAYVEFANGSVFNSTDAYRKNWDMVELSGFGKFSPLSTPTAGTRAKKTGLAYNGLLHAWSATAVAAPSQLPLFTQIGGNLNADGADTGPIPTLGCDDPNTPCTYQPASGANCSTSVNGAYTYYFYPNASQWLYGQSQTWVFADSSAKSRRLASNIGGKTDFRTDPYTNYLKGGVDNTTAWYDEGYCHALLFRPDFDFSTFPTNPVAAP